MQKISNHLKFKGNPRIISSEAKDKLKKHLEQLGDLSGVVYCRHNKAYVGGNQRSDIFNGSEIELIKTFKDKTSQGTKAIGFINFEGERHAYREVEFTEEQFKKACIVANTSAGVWDGEVLASDWDADELKEWGVGEIANELSEVEEEDTNEYEIEVGEKKFDTKNGDVYLVAGKHYLFCGSCTDERIVEKLRKLPKAELAVNDPPYGMGYSKKGVVGDNINRDEFLQFATQWLNVQLELLVDSYSLYVFGLDESLMELHVQFFMPLAKANKITFRNLLTWDKGSGRGMNSDLPRMYVTADEKMLFYMGGVQGFKNNSDNYYEGWEPIRQYLLKSRLEMGWDIPTMKDVVGHSNKSPDHWTSKSQWLLPTEDVYNKMKAVADEKRKTSLNLQAFKKDYAEIQKEYKLIQKEYKLIQKDVRAIRAYFNNTHAVFNNVLHFPRTNKEAEFVTSQHYTPKPMPFIKHLIKTSSMEEWRVLDFFGGTGTTMLACEQLNRICYMVELDETHCSSILERMQLYNPDIKIVKLDNEGQQ